MAILYIVTVLVLIVTNIEKLPGALATIIEYAFGVKAVAGGVLSSIAISMQKGIARGIFSNEAGLGSAPIAAAAANNSNETVSIDGADYVIDKDGKISKGGTELGADATADLTEIKKLVVAGATVKYGDKSMTVMDAQNGVDKDDSSVITAGTHLSLIHI